MDMSQTVGENLPIRRGAAAGAIAWIVGIVGTYALATLEVWGEFVARFVSQAPITISLGLYLDIHSWFYTSQFTVDYLLYTVIVIVLLLAAGFTTAYGGRQSSPAQGFAHGATVAVGYLALLIVTVVVMTVFGTDSGGTDMDTIVQLLLAGIVYPVVFGGIGGVIADAA